MLTSSEVADMAELHQLAFRYAAAVDACDAEAFVSVFHPEGRLRVYQPGAEEPTVTLTGAEELGGVPEAMRRRFTRTAHLMTNHLLDLEGDRASGSLLCTARHLHANPAGGVDLVIVIRYVDRYVRHGDRWCIRDREIRYLWGATHAALKEEHTW